MINLVSSKVTHVGEIMIGFTNYDVTQYIWYQTVCKRIDYICAKFGYYFPFG